MQSFYKGDSKGWLTQHLSPYKDLYGDVKEPSLGKISLTHVPGKLKPRVFAIVDTVTQTILSELHIQLMRLLRTFEGDCTHDQNKVSIVAKEM